MRRNYKRRYCVLFTKSKIIIRGVSPRAREAVCKVFNEDYKFISMRTADEMETFIGYPSYECDVHGNLYHSYPDSPFMNNEILHTAISHNK